MTEYNSSVPQSLARESAKHTEYMFFLWTKEGYLQWQFAFETDKNPEDLGDALKKAYNEWNDVHVSPEWEVDTVTYCTFEDWIKILRTRGKEYKKGIKA